MRFAWSLTASLLLLVLNLALPVRGIELRGEKHEEQLALVETSASEEALVSDFADAAWNIKKAVGKAVKKTQSVAKDVGKAVTKTTNNVVKDTKDAVNSAVKDTQTAVNSAVKDTVKDTKNALNSAANTVKNTAEKAVDKVADAVDKAVDRLTTNGPLSNTPWFDVPFAKRMLDYAKAAYCPEKNISPTSWSCTTCKGWLADFKVIETPKSSKVDSFGYIGYNPRFNEIIYAFRGSTSTKNWISNLKFWQTDTDFAGVKGARVAKGWMDTWHSVRTTGITSVKKAQAAYPTAKVRVVGHSLGGAVACIAALDLHVHGIKNLHLFTFGAPRAGNKEFAQALNTRLGVANMWRMVHDDDPVPHLPPKQVGFLHPLREVWTRGNQIYHVCSDKNAEDPSCSASMIIPDFTLHDHNNYMGVTAYCGNNQG